MSHNFHFELPASRIVQGEQQMLFVSVLWSSLERLLVMENYSSTLERSQRELNLTRAKNFTAYLRNAYVNKSPFIVPPLIGNCDAEIEVTDIGNTNLCIVRVPFNARIELFDGQHRARGIIDYVRENSECRHYCVGIQLTLNLPLKARQQFFSDINNNASKPAAAINMAYDGNNALAQNVLSVLNRLHNVNCHVDFEHNAVPARSDKWISFKALCDASAKMMAKRPDDDSPETQIEDLFQLWNAWSLLTDLDEHATTYRSSEYRKEFLTFHAVTINAFAWAVRQLLDSLPISEIVRRIEALAMQATWKDRDNYFSIEKWAGICVDASRLTLRSDVRSQKMAGQCIADSLLNGRFIAPSECLSARAE
ncbi:DGQHR domain-containing protein [Cronobacter sakazakii]|nr:DGQHR domain-containing protein [Cronobacter sakazakii]